ncbi:MAG: hypothetical protein J0H80_13755 [Rhizobiales bacterium]|nr:hypothetical protein [Hyphomicrobiales bacterium]
MEAKDSELLEMTGEDLDFLERQLHVDATKADIRHSSVVLRRLLIEDSLLKSWRLLNLQPKQPIILAVKLQQELIYADTVSWVGGAQTGDIIISQVRFSHRALSEDEIRARAAIKPSLHEFRLYDFMLSTAVVAEGKKINRQQLLAYIANKRGGAHLDYGRKRKDDEAYKILDKLDASQGKIGNTGLPPSIHELLSIGQALINSEDIKRLRQLIKP